MARSGVKFAAHRIGTAVTGTPEWHHLREGLMTGSRIAAAAGISPWESPFSLYYSMIGFAPIDISDREEIEWGNRHEPTIIQKYKDMHPNLRVRTRVGVWANNDRPWQAASPDAFIIDPGPWGRRYPTTGIFEAKTSRYDTDFGPSGTDQIPIYYRAQVTHYLDVTGLQYADLGVLIGGCGYREYRIEWDKEDAEFLRDVGREFLDRVARRDRPDIDGSEGTFRTIQRFHPDIDGTTVDVPADIAAELAAAKEEFDYAQAELTRTSSVLQEYMGTAKVAQVALDDGSAVKLADRRSKNGGQPYMQLASIKKHVTKLSQLRKVS